MASHCFTPPAAVLAQTLASQWIGQHIPQVVPSQGSAQDPGLVITAPRPASLSRTRNCCAKGLCTRAAASKSHMLLGQPIPLYRLQAQFSEYRLSTLTSLSPLITDYFIIFHLCNVSASSQTISVCQCHQNKGPQSRRLKKQKFVFS